jgi:deoxycytidine triphosphate deaminase
MKFVFRWIRKRLREVEREYEPQYDKPSTLVSNKSDSIDTNGTRFTVYKADGGHVVETRTYDRNHDSETSLYIVTSEQDLGQRLAHIVTYESIKR